MARCKGADVTGGISSRSHRRQGEEQETEEPCCMMWVDSLELKSALSPLQAGVQLNAYRKLAVDEIEAGVGQHREVHTTIKSRERKQTKYMEGKNQKHQKSSEHRLMRVEKVGELFDG